MQHQLRQTPQERLSQYTREWSVIVERTLETESSLVAFGKRAGKKVVVKAVRQPCDEWRAGEVLNAFGGKGAARVFAYADGIVLLERLSPGHSLEGLVLADKDGEATEILADVVRRLPECKIPPRCPMVSDSAVSFKRYLATSDASVPRHLAEEAQARYSKLSASQRRLRLLHGDLHHSNVLFDTRRGWVAIDPKGLAGEIEYEIGASLRNPLEVLDRFTTPAIIERRVNAFARSLSLDIGRVLEWSFAQAILSLIWRREDGQRVDPGHPCVRLAEAIRPMLPRT